MKIGFDLDGTLITCFEKQAALMSYICFPHRQDVDIRKMWLSKRDGATGISALMTQELSFQMAQEIVRQWTSIVEDKYWLGFDGLKKGAIELLESVKKHQCEMHLVTARKNFWNCISQLKSLGIFDYFSEIHVVSPLDAVNKKAEVLERCGIDLFIGDTETDVESSRLANIDFLGVTDGQRSKIYLNEFKVNLVDNLEQALKYVNSRL